MPSSGDITFSIFTAVGAVSLFLMGVGILSDAFFRRISASFFRLLSGGDGGWWRKLYRGFAAGLLSGNPAAGSVLIVSMAEAGTLPERSIPTVVSGYRLGSLLFGFLLAMVVRSSGSISTGLILLAFAVPFALNVRRRNRLQLDVLIGAGLVFLSVQLLDSNLHGQVFSSLYSMHRILASTSPLFLLITFAAGSLLSVLLRSSLVPLVLALSLSAASWLAPQSAFMLLLGGRLGDTCTALLSSVRLGVRGRRAALVQLLVELAAYVWLPLVFFAASFMDGQFACCAPLYLLAGQFVMYVGSLLLLPLVSFLPLLVRRILSADESQLDEGDSTFIDYHLELVPAGWPEALDANLQQTQRALSYMADSTYRMLVRVMNSSQISDDCQLAFEEVQRQEMDLCSVRRKISKALLGSVQQACSRKQAETIQRQQRIAHELRQIGSDCRHSLDILCRSYKKKYRFHEEASEELFAFVAQVMDFLQYNADYLQNRFDSFDTQLAARMEEGINVARDRLKKRSRRCMERGQDVQIRGELAFIEIVGYLENIGDSCLHIAQTVPHLQRFR